MKYAVMMGLSALLMASAGFAQQGTGNYISLGEYTNGVVNEAISPPATYEVIPLPDAVEGGGVHAAPPLYTDIPVYTDVEVQTRPILAPAPQFVPDAPLAPVAIAPVPGFNDPEYDAARLAAYDTNRDGTISPREAIATLKPLAGL